MERLTFEGNFCDIAQCRELPCKYDGNCTQKEVWERLKQFEDAVQTPEKAAWAKKTIEMAFSDDTSEVERLRELYKADKEGRLVVLPVRPVLTQSCASMLYIVDDDEIYEDSLYEAVVGMSSSGRTNVIYTTLSDQMIFGQEAIGKTVFLTREEAEKALQEMEGKG
jgi:hypothetical protein|nr:MAG TPA: hypothetical protein [Caudoviricetes sp.]